MKKLQPIKGFQVMEWLGQVRDEQYRLYKENPAAYFKGIRACEKRIERRLANRRRSNRANPKRLALKDTLLSNHKEM